MRPREYAVEILKIETKDARRSYLESNVPENFRELVSRYVRMWWPIRERIIK